MKNDRTGTCRNQDEPRGTHEHHAWLDDQTHKTVKAAASRLANTRGFTPGEAKDIEQDIYLELLRRLPFYDPERGPIRPFIWLIVGNKVRKLVAHRRAECRDPGRLEYSLDEPTERPDGETVERGELVAAEDLDSDWAGGVVDHDLLIDPCRAHRALPPDLAVIWNRLKHQTKSDIARAMGTRRGKVYRMVRKIRDVATSAGLREYLETDTF